MKTSGIPHIQFDLDGTLINSHSEGKPKLYEDTIPTLEKLQEMGCTMSILTLIGKEGKDAQWDKVLRERLQRYCTGIEVASSLEEKKRHIFAMRYICHPKEVIVVDDRLDGGILFAGELRIRNYRVIRKGEKYAWDEPVGGLRVPTWEGSTLLDLPPIIAEIIKKNHRKPY